MEVEATSKLWNGELFYDFLCVVLDFLFFLKFIINKFQIISGLSYVQNIPIVALVKLNLKKQ